MKFLYTYEEINELSHKEILELSTFSNNKYFYSDIYEIGTVDNFSDKDKPEYYVTFLNGNSIYTTDKSIFDAIKIGKSRWELIGKSVESKDTLEKLETDFYNRTIKLIDNYFKKASSENKDNMKELNRKFEEHLKNTEEEAYNSTKKINELQEKILGLRLQEKAEKLDKIISSFDVLFK
jgi:hypothetical protein